MAVTDDSDAGDNDDGNDNSKRSSRVLSREQACPCPSSSPRDHLHI